MSSSTCKEIPSEARGIYRLTDLEISFVSACPQGANPGAKVILKKEMIQMDKKENNQQNVESPVNVNIDFGEFSKTLSENLKNVLDPLLQKEKVSAEVVVDSVVAVTSSEMEKMKDSIQNQLKKAVDDLQKELNQKQINKQDDESIVLDGKTFHKSKMGEDAFAAISAIYQSNQKLQKEMCHRELVSRVEKEYPNIAGTPEQKAALLDLIEKAEDPVKETGIAVLKALNENNSLMKKEIGSGTNNQSTSDVQKFDTDSEASLKLEKMAEELANKEGISKADAYLKVCDTPEGERLYEEHLKHVSGR